jgi:hypothetical protein
MRLRGISSSSPKLTHPRPAPKFDRRPSRRCHPFETPIPFSNPPRFQSAHSHLMAQFSVTCLFDALGISMRYRESKSVPHQDRHCAVSRAEVMGEYAWPLGLHTFLCQSSFWNGDCSFVLIRPRRMLAPNSKSGNLNRCQLIGISPCRPWI